RTPVVVVVWSTIHQRIPGDDDPGGRLARPLIHRTGRVPAEHAWSAEAVRCSHGHFSSFEYCAEPASRTRLGTCRSGNRDVRVANRAVNPAVSHRADAASGRYCHLAHLEAHVKRRPTVTPGTLTNTRFTLRNLLKSRWRDRPPSQLQRP